MPAENTVRLMALQENWRRRSESNQDTAEKKFAGRTNIKHSWESDRRIVASTSGDMAYEHGTMEMSYGEDGKPHHFKAVMLNVYKAKGGTCQKVAGTMEPLKEDR